MKNIEELVRARRSVRSYSSRAIEADVIENLCSYMSEIKTPYNLPVEFKLIGGMSSPVIVGTNLYVAAKMANSECANVAFGYSFECMMLYAQSLGLGTTCIGGTMDRAAFEKAAELAPGEIMPCVTPIGYPAEKMSLREVMMRKGVKADDRLAFEEIIFSGSFDKPMTKAEAGALALPLELVRLAPSAVNRQPWRVVVADGAVHFYLKRSKGFAAGIIDMQKIDLGIALCNFDLAAQELGIAVEFAIADPGIPAEGMEYIASYKYSV